jgi:integrase
MAIRMAALTRSKTGGYTARKVIPKDVRDPYTRPHGVAWEAKLSIPANTPLHEAKRLHGEWIADVETQIGALRAVAKGEGQPLTKRNAVALAGRWYVWFVAEYEGDPGSPKRWSEPIDSYIWDHLSIHAPAEYHEDPGADPHWLWAREPEVREAVRPTVAEMARTVSFLAKEGIALNSEANNLFVDEVSDHLFAAFKLLEKRAWGDYTPDETPKKFPQYVASRASTPVGLGCWALFEAWVTAAKPKPATVDRWRVIFKALDAAFPDGANAVTADQARTWAKGLTTKKRSARTVATNWVNAPRRVFAWGLEERLVTVNPFVGIKISVPRKAETRESKAFTNMEARLILKAALGVSNIKTDAHAAQRWAPWLMAYTGARAGEITQLRGSDVQQRGSFHYAVLTPDAGTIKTRKVRVVPLHEHIIAQGFLSFVETRGKGPLFFTPEATKGAVDPFNPKRPRAVRIREALAAWVRKLGVSDRELSPNHAWRHTFKAQAERVGITEKISDAITGHAASTVGRSYGAPLAEDMAKALQKFPRYVV